MENYLVILFKNKKKQRIIKKFKSFDKCKLYYSEMLTKSDGVIFDVQVENGCDVKYEIAIITNKISSSFPTYKVDEFGRNMKIKLDDSDMSIVEINSFKKEELIMDLNVGNKIPITKFIKDYLSSKELKMISVLNNKLIVQINENFKIFSLKSELECDRFMKILSSHFLKIKRDDCLFISDTSSAQRKYLYELLERNGFDKDIFYRKFTTHPRPK